MKYLLYNPLSGSGNSEREADRFSKSIESSSKLVNITEITSYCDFFASLGTEDAVYIFGGDGTLHKFVNGLGDIEPKCGIYYFPAGTGNDFYADFSSEPASEPMLINDYIKNLPVVTVKGNEYRFINGVGYGIDGYCCEVGDELKRNNKLPNYTSIAIKGLLFHYKPTNATIIVDGKEEVYKKVWIAPTMFGAHYGGGMIPTPDQKRAEDGHLSLMVFHGSGKIKTLMIFPSIFKGKHVEKKKHVKVICGKEITVKFDRPTALQIDGETILDVTEYTARVHECAKV